MRAARLCERRPAVPLPFPAPPAQRSGNLPPPPRSTVAGPLLPNAWQKGSNGPHSTLTKGPAALQRLINLIQHQPSCTGGHSMKLTEWPEVQSRPQKEVLPHTAHN